MNKLTTDRVKLLRAIERVSLKPDFPESGIVTELFERIRADEYGHFVSYSQEDPSKISYARHPSEKFNNVRRVRTTLSRYIRRCLSYTESALSADCIEKISCCVFAELLSGGEEEETKVVSGAAITLAYEEEVGGSSCMTGEDNDKVLLYEENPDKVQLVIWGGGEARALLWRTDEGVTVMDRIYPNKGRHIIPMRAWASRRGYTRREHDSMVSDGTVPLVPHECLTVTLDPPTNGKYPYMDTFFYAWNDGVGIRVSNGYSRGACELHSTSGAGVGHMPCENCGASVNDDDARFNTQDDTIWCESCWDHFFRWCRCCEEDRPSEDGDMVEDEWCCADCVEQHTTMCSQCDKRFSDCSGDVEWIECVGEHRCRECRDDIILCDQCSEWTKAEDYEINRNGDGYCEDCKPEDEDDDEENEEGALDESTSGTTGSSAESPRLAIA